MTARTSKKAPKFDPEMHWTVRRMVKFHWWMLLPRGLYFKQDGSEVIFDREYRPIWHELINGTIEIVPSDEYIPHLIRVYSYYHDSTELFKTPTKISKLVTEVRRVGLISEIERRATLLFEDRLPEFGF